MCFHRPDPPKIVLPLVPKLPPTPAPPPTPIDPAVVSSQKKAKKKAAAATGTKTILTSGLGLTTPADNAPKTLLGA